MDASPTSVKQSQMLVRQFKSAPLYQDYKQAFREATDLSLELLPAGTVEPLCSDAPGCNPFCAMMARTPGPACAFCQQHHARVMEAGADGPATIKCPAGMFTSAVPIRVGEAPVAFLMTGQVFQQKPTRSQFGQVSRQMSRFGATFDPRTLREAYFKGCVVTKKHYDAALRLLQVFSQYFASLSNRLIMLEEHQESPVIARARRFINEHAEEDLTLEQVAHSVNTSTFYFCKMFKKFTDMTFTDYLARVRVEKVRNLLLNPHKRVSEAAFEAGFQSLSQFNRVFRKIEGCSPSAHRAQMHSAFPGR